jgi:hemerythrin-like domain-containing protein
MPKTHGRKGAKDAISILKKDHQTVRELLGKLESARMRPSKTRETLLSQIEHEVKVHSQLEKEIFYPAFKESVPKKDEQILYFESLEEHRLVDTVIDEFHEEQQDDESFAARCKVLSDLLEHHLQEEERELFPVAKKSMDSDMLRELGEQIDQRKTELWNELQ